MNIINNNIELPVLNYEGNQIDTVKLAEWVFGVEAHEDAVQLAVKVDLSNRRQATAKTKTRSEVSGGGKKPWRQKGTGRARAGSSRSPLWRHGGTVFGPTGTQNYKLKMNKQVHFLALASVLSDKVASNNLVVVTDEKFAEPKTKKFAEALAALKAGKKVLFAIEEYDDNLVRAASNIPGLFLVSCDNISVYDVLNADTVIMTKACATCLSGECDCENEEVSE